MKTLKRLSVFVLLLFPLILPAQVSFSGKVLSPEGEPVSFANILLRSQVDSSLVKGGLSDDAGSFTLNTNREGQFFIEANMIGYSSSFSPVYDVTAGDKVQLASLILSEGIALEEVQVVGRKPLFEQKIDRMVVNVSNSLTSAGGTALEVLERSPGVVVNKQNDAISLVGKDGVVVMINGKITYTPAAQIVTLLEGMSADNIESIELITTPPAKYDAEGNAGFINIVLKKRTDLGLNGNFSVSGGFGDGEVASANLAMNYRNNRVNLFGSYSFVYEHQLQRFENYRRVNFMDVVTQTSTITDRDPTQQDHNLRLGMDYEIGEKTILGALFTAYDEKWTMEAINESMLEVNGELNERVILDNSELNQWRHLGGNLNFQHNFSDQEKLTANVDYLYFHDDNPTDYLNDFFNSKGELTRSETMRSGKLTPIDITVGMLDYEKQLSEKLRLSLGAKAGLSNFTNDVSVDELINNDWVPNVEFTNMSVLDERIYAGYSSLDIKANEKNNFKVGVRYEFTDSEMNSDRDGLVVDREFGMFFPSLFYSHNMNEDNGINVAYSRRITRPTFNQMAPFVIFLDPNTYFFGNTALQPAISDNIKVDYRHKSLVFSLAYTYEDSTIARFQDRVDLETNQQLIEPINLDYSHSVSFLTGLPVYIGSWWEMQNNFILTWSEANSFYNGTEVTVNNTNFRLNTTQTFLLPQDWSFELSFFYRSRGLWGLSSFDPMYGLGFGLQKKLKNNWGTLRINGTDLLESIVWGGETRIPGQGFETWGSFDFSQRTFRLTYARNFGNNKLKASRRRGTASDEERRRIN